MKTVCLKNGWHLRAAPRANLPSGFSLPITGIPVKVPGTVHTNLLSAKLIPDPFYTDNEARLQWIHENDWIYSTQFDRLPEFNSTEPLYLIFEGLDTLAEIFLNGDLIGSTDNMFRKYSFRVDHLLKPTSNHLKIRFTSPLRGARNLEKKYGKLMVSLNSERVYLRKAQYSFGWDWGPSFPTMGIWKPVYLLQRESAWISSIRFSTSRLYHNKAIVRVQVELEGKAGQNRIMVELKDSEQKIVATESADGKKELDFTWNINTPDLWWPNGEGVPYLYSILVNLIDASGKEIDRREKRVGIRTIELQTVHKGKNTFRFLINSKPIYVKGVNWIPADSFLPRVSENKYRSLLQMAADAHMNMVRVWGGGIYEQDIFYDTCDELGLLVWQDFMFACGAYPEIPVFMQNVTTEAKEAIRRLQHHPCLALWCGNNENEWDWYHSPGRSIAEMPGYGIYHRLLPNMLKKLDPSRPYWPSSPFGLDKDPNSETSGNRHEWDIWSSWKDYSEVNSDKSLFITEFGFQAPANFHALDKVIPPDHRKTHDHLFEFHNKQIEGNERLFKFMAGHFPVHSNWWDFIYLTQLNQGIALKTCLEHWRFGSPATNGTIIWQLNDCWPAISWALIDNENNPKMAYYMVKSVFSPLALYFHRNKEFLNVMLRDERGEIPHGRIRIDAINRLNGVSKILMDKKVVQNFNPKMVVKENKLGTIEKFDESILVATLFDHKDNIRARNFFLTFRWKYCNLCMPSIMIKPAGKHRLEISTDFPSFFVDLYHPDVNFGSRGMIILPGEKHDISYTRIQGKKPFLENIRIFCLNHYLAGTADPKIHHRSNI